MCYRCLLLLAFVTSLSAAMQTRELRYEFEGVEFLATVTWSDAHDSARPAVLMVPNWMGPSDESLDKAKLVAGDRYVVCMADVYGADVRPSNREEASAAAGALRGDRALMRRRGNEALRQFLALADALPIDVERTAAIGFCFGGGTVLELARSGTELDAVVSFHGNLDTPDPADAQNIKAGVLVCHGADDPAVPPAQVAAFKQEMRAVEGLDWQLIEYGGAVHSFTNPHADTPGRSQYDQRVAKRAFALMHDFLAERFALGRSE